MKYVKFLNEISLADVKQAGGKGASLGEMLKFKMPVPEGFVILAEVCQFSRGVIPSELKKEIFEAFDKLGAQKTAVRSSALVEDSRTASWAGQLESFLNVKREKLLESIKNCWKSVRSKRVLAYATEQNLSRDKLTVAVVVQKMVQSEISGVCFTVHPVTKNKNEMIVEAVCGLGESLVQGKTTPDNYVIRKSGLKILNINTPIGEKRKLSDKQLKKLARLCLKIEKHYKISQDVEWAFVRSKFYILQSRPITTL